jgi:hypothetical protein
VWVKEVHADPIFAVNHLCCGLKYRFMDRPVFIDDLPVDIQQGHEPDALSSGEGGQVGISEEALFSVKIDLLCQLQKAQDQGLSQRKHFL